MIKNSSSFDSVFLQSACGWLLIDSEFTLLQVNSWVLKRIGRTKNEVLGTTLFHCFPGLKAAVYKNALKNALSVGGTHYLSQTLDSKVLGLKDEMGQAICPLLVLSPFIDESREIFYLLQITDISAIVRREKSLNTQIKRLKGVNHDLLREVERAKVTLNSIADAVITTDTQGRIVAMNPVAELITGVALEDAEHKDVGQVFRLISEKDFQPLDCPVNYCLHTKEPISNDSEHVLLTATGKISITDSVAPILDEDNILHGAVLVFRDVTQSRALSEKLNWQALHDPLTGLANRRKFEISMNDFLRQARENGCKHHLLYLDLDQFKVVNDTCGHDAGDELLKQLTVCLMSKLRKSDILARLGGDEFGVLLQNCDTEHALWVANNLRQQVEQFRFGWQAQSFRIGVSIGVAEINGTEAKSSEILSAADAACYAAKESGRNRVFYQNTSETSASNQQEMKWISRLQQALDKDSFVLYLQRIQSIDPKKLHHDHYEVMLRMIGEQGELIPPGAFLPAAERFSLISKLDSWVVEQVFKKIHRLIVKGGNPDQLFFAINLSGGSMVDNDLLDKLMGLLDHSPIPPSHFCFEVTETATIANLNEATCFLKQLKSRGCKIALDDFGSGLSSFAYLKQLPIDFLKIDGYFVKDIVFDSVDRAFVESINQIGQVMHLQTIAEFVENDEILETIKAIGVDFAQGYGVHKPCPFDEVFPLN